MSIKSFFIPPMRNEIEAKKIAKLCAIYFFVISALYIIFALIQFGTWSFSSSNTYFRILENLFIGFAIIMSWRTVLYILLCMQILLLTYIFYADLNLKIINIMSLVVIIYALFAVYKYYEMKTK
jgi:hypothetical protein